MVDNLGIIAHKTGIAQLWTGLKTPLDPQFSARRRKNRTMKIPH